MRWSLRKVWDLAGLAILFLGANQGMAVSVRPADPLVTIKLGLMDCFSVADVPGMERLRSASEGAFYYAIGENAKAFEGCGYRLQLAISNFDLNDRYAAKETASLLEQRNTWIIVGPRRSDQFIIATKGLTRTPMISMSAGSNAVLALPPPFFTNFPSVDSHIGALIKSIKKENFGFSYGTLTDATCTACKDFVEIFDRKAIGNFQKKFALEVAGDAPDLTDLRISLSQKGVDFLFMPNFSKLSNFTIQELQTQFPNLKYVGGNWGEGPYGFVDESTKILPSVKGLAALPLLPPGRMEEIYRVHSMDREWNGEVLTPPGNGYRIIDFIRILRNDLCGLKAKGKRLADKEAFYRFYAEKESSHFAGKQIMGIYKLENSKFQFAYEEAL